MKISCAQFSASVMLCDLYYGLEYKRTLDGLLTIDCIRNVVVFNTIAYWTSMTIETCHLFANCVNPMPLHKWLKNQLVVRVFGTINPLSSIRIMLAVDTCKKVDIVIMIWTVNSVLYYPLKVIRYIWLWIVYYQLTPVVVNLL